MKIAVIGNAGGGKTTLSRRLGEIHGVPVTHVDSIQFLPGMIIRPMNETRNILNTVTKNASWLIDGYGPLDQLEPRLALADKIVFIDLPIQLHFWWVLKRQIKSLWSRRTELPEGCNEANWAHTVKLFKTMWRAHTQMRPELIRILRRDNLREKVIHISTLDQWQSLYNIGLHTNN